MTPFGILGVALLSVVVTVIYRLLFGKRADGGPRKVERATAGDGYHYLGSDDDEGRGRYGLQRAPPRAKLTIALTPRQLERVNIQRKLRGKPPLNRDGFKNAVAHPWTAPLAVQPQSTADWLAYLIAYQCLLPAHEGMTRVSTGLTVDPNSRYNGQGYELPGAGVSGDWSNGITRSEGSAIEHPSDPYAAVADGIVSTYQRSDAAFDTPKADVGGAGPPDSGK
jgi:hypothetical protein